MTVIRNRYEEKNPVARSDKDRRLSGDSIRDLLIFFGRNGTFGLCCCVCRRGKDGSSFFTKFAKIGCARGLGVV
jgi:hypothetical protein